MEPVQSVVCTFVVASAGRTLFTEERENPPKAGELISYDSKAYEVLSVSPPEAPPAEPSDDAAPQFSALVRVRPTG